jgi:hypothetical protein
MPKDATKNVDRYKVRGGQLNEFEYTQNQKALAGNKGKTGAKLIPGTPPEDGEATSKATKSTKATKKASPTKGATAKKLAARKATKKK